MNPLGWSLIVSWVLHGALIVLVSVSIGAQRRSHGFVLDLIAPSNTGPSAPASTPTPSALPRPAATPSRAAPPPANSRHATIPAPPVSSPAPGPADAAASRTSERGSMPAPDPGAAAADVARATGLPLTPPRPSGPIAPRYPESARASGAQGTTLLKLHVRADGSVDAVIVERSSGHVDLDAAAVQAVKPSRFEPARRGGDAVDQWVILPVRFTLGELSGAAAPLRAGRSA